MGLTNVTRKTGSTKSYGRPTSLTINRFRGLQTRRVVLSLAVFFLQLVFTASLFAGYFNGDVYTTESGLPTNLIKKVLQEPNGFAWIATDAGLLRFDGEHFVSYKDKISTRYIKNIVRSPKGELYVVSDLGIYKIVRNGYQSDIKLFLPGSKNLTDSTLFFPKDLYFASDGSLWISEPCSVVRFQNGKIKRYFFSDRYLTNRYDRSFLFLSPSPELFLVASQTGFLFYFSQDKETFLPLELKNRPAGFNINILVKSPGGEIWVAGKSGIYSLTFSADQKTAHLTPRFKIAEITALAFLNPNLLLIGTENQGFYYAKKKDGHWEVRSEDIFPLQGIHSITFGADGSLWISSDEGFARLYENFFFPISTGQAAQFVEDICTDRQGTIYFTDGYRVYRVRVEAGEATLRPIYISPSDLITSLAVRNGHLWLGYRSGKLQRIGENGQVKNFTLNSRLKRQIECIFTDRNNQLWIALDNLNGVYRITPELHIDFFDESSGIQSPVTMITESPDGQIWLGAVGNNAYLYQFDSQHQRFLNKSIPISFAYAAPMSVYDLEFDEHGSLWLATNVGVYRYSREGIAVPKGLQVLTNRIITALLIDQDKRVWSGTESGLYL